jgi:hypothetical protein
MPSAAAKRGPLKNASGKNLGAAWGKNTGDSFPFLENGYCQKAGWAASWLSS